MAAKGGHGGKASLLDVAALAGVSTSAVSLVLNGKDAGRVSAEVRERVLRAGDELGYRIDRRARGLATGRTGIVGFVAPDVSNPFFSMVQSGLLAELSSDFQLITVVTELGHSVAQENIRQMFALGVDGLIVATVHSDVVTSINDRTPVVILDSPGRQRGAPRINLEVQSSARKLADHLVGLGHRRFSYLEATTGTKTLESRRKTFRSAIKRLAADSDMITSRCDIDVEAARDAVKQRWHEWRDYGVTAVVCATEMQAFGTLGAFEDLGVRVPADVSIAGADEQTISTIVRPALTTVRLPAFELGQLGARQLRRLMAGVAPEEMDNAITLPTQLCIRDSTGQSARQP